MLTVEDINKIAELFDRKFDEKFEEKFQTRLKPMQSDINLLKDMVSDIQFRLDVGQLPSIESQVAS